MQVILDAFGGDNAPYSVIDGSLLAITQFNDIDIVLVGNEIIINKYLATKIYNKSKIKVLHAETQIDNNEAPVEAIRSKKDSSMVVAFEYLKENNCDAFISAGSTGALLAGSLLKIGRVKGVGRPALAPLIPTEKGTYCLIMDCGANMDCKPENLIQFAIIANIYYYVLFEKYPKIALLNVGTEEHKGNEMLKEVYKKLSQLPINFVGNMEARDLTSGNYDVVICDGFAGNVLLKATEGACNLVLNELKSNIKKSFFSKIGAMFMKKTFKNIKKKLDYNKYGGSPILGVKKIVIKSHGSSVAETIASAIKQAKKLYDLQLIDKINDKLSGNVSSKEGV